MDAQEKSGGSGVLLPDDHQSPLWRAIHERKAIAQGWLKGASGVGLDGEKLGAIAAHNAALAIDRTTAPRVQTSASRNVIAIVAQVMEQERRDACLPAPGAEQVTSPRDIVQLILARCGHAAISVTQLSVTTATTVTVPGPPADMPADLPAESDDDGED